ncbi:uncharacterized protein LOC110834429 isoform X1 [Zootermopsis nevadensis]|uniref:uncharacterized protein LOC110834429 isoform X1 n=1 Tax=Zootermopsis nevadensis TaxID=136037 RepID=UPI000B8E6159|nr:uncharacterized protein LOC110834429 isoform X1 [Zootermopsis nevadensis]
MARNKPFSVNQLVIGVAVVFTVAATSADPKLHSSYNYVTAPETPENYNEVQYHYRYAVDDPLSGVINDRWEHRHGEYVKGAYSVLGPDGRVRTVDYEVDGPKGFHAVIRTQFPSNSLLSYIQLQKSLKQHKDPPVNILTNQRIPTDNPEFNSQRTARLLHKDLPVNFHSISPNYYLSLIPGKRTNYGSSHKNPVTDVFIAASPDQEYDHEHRSTSTPNTEDRYADPRTDSGQPSQLFLPPPLPTSLYAEATSSTQFTRTYFGG